MQPERPLPRPIGSAAEAQAFATDFIETMGRLERVIQEETALLKESRLNEAAALAPAKTDASRNYVRGLEALRSNAVALARWNPDGVARLKKAQASLSDALSVNMAVLATARTVSETIVRSLAQEVAAPRTLNTYGAAGRATSRAATTPLVIARNL
jgi:hypothetical protein